MASFILFLATVLVASLVAIGRHRRSLVADRTGARLDACIADRRRHCNPTRDRNATGGK
jgi:hypothetical protein